MDAIAFLQNNKDIILTCSPVILFATFIVASLNYFHTKKNQTYANLDSLYLEHLKLGMNHPKFRDPKYTCNYKTEFKDDELFRYEIYAFIAWNICETIYDRKLKSEFDTWKPIIDEENLLHRKWFNDPENFHKFKDKFREYIQKNFPENMIIKEIIDISAEMNGSIIQVSNNSFELRTNDDMQNVIQYSPNKENESDQKIKEIIEKLNLNELNYNIQQYKIENMKTQIQALFNQLQTTQNKENESDRKIKEIIEKLNLNELNYNIQQDRMEDVKT